MIASSSSSGIFSFFLISFSFRSRLFPVFTAGVTCGVACIAPRGVLKRGIREIWFADSSRVWRGGESHSRGFSLSRRRCSLSISKVRRYSIHDAMMISCKQLVAAVTGPMYQTNARLPWLCWKAVTYHRNAGIAVAIANAASMPNIMSMSCRSSKM